MNTWHVNVTFSAAEPFSDDTPFDVSDELERFAAVLSVSRALDSGTAAMTVEASDALDAIKQGRDALTEALGNHGIIPTVTGVRAQDPAEFQAELESPAYPPVVGYAEIADMAGVSRQRARQFADKETFPHPVIRTAQGPLFNLPAIERWLADRTATAHQPA